MNKSQEKRIPILITGGHHDPAVAVIEALQERGNFQFFWVGHRYSLSGEQTESAEFKTITRLGIPFFHLQTGKFYRASWQNLVRVPLGFLHALYLLIRTRPKLVISFGGYLAAPVVLAAYLLRIPAVTHEQTVVFGWANRFISLFAKRIFVSWRSSLKYFPSGKTVLTGNPVRPEVFEERTKRFRFENDLPVVYVTGGKQGSHVINEAVRGVLSQFLENYNLIHQTGSSARFQDYQKLSILRSQLPRKLQNRYILQEYFGLDEIGAVYRAAAVVIGRAGANTVTELAALGKPAILIPISWVSRREQFLNARILEEIGAAVVLEEEQLSSRSLKQNLDDIFANLRKYQKAAEKARQLINPRAASQIASEIIRLIR
ncbi:MAG: UDP-N-acetylglucosamine--N-acetylmuramyl-(pentapeptide) pyrophosphoryl-UDP N-acetylglucosamine transferase [candidate division WWE3 bacterium CSP1-7]|uniref:UDP-N-acetylglucosamine--N-acetylmuramyl-(pentapeptide) pyrophosphoryl-undecaprenol N-acetylglucosamine transferase n=1 Tax=candidate division WWE3 bacterium CSP1-7 TaxID=1576480 RepID=A0A0T5ZXS7_UNCKA|nr:MAG: UDP-N-acetylglucosamine--N-acetylmuramyl-(pentapeptide) pyrophosphoryl-UDP N-acetylglucosamine transferase [candidate division WWE3 bacterium CSP1-7]